jgi:hypothetical protein
MITSGGKVTVNLHICHLHFLAFCSSEVFLFFPLKTYLGNSGKIAEQLEFQDKKNLDKNYSKIGKLCPRTLHNLERKEQIINSYTTSVLSISMQEAVGFLINLRTELQNSDFKIHGG